MIRSWREYSGKVSDKIPITSVGPSQIEGIKSEFTPSTLGDCPAAGNETDSSAFTDANVDELSTDRTSIE